MMMASVAMSVTLWLLQSELFNGTDYVRGSRWAALFILVTIGVGVYGLAGQALGAFDLREARRVLARRTEAVSSSR
ncbi:MAG: hypothetical protein JOY71_08035 [Acetobacteraceae bacterium]|nr:hypothetical protein [Acetobacteraceae bacterium]